MRLKLPPKVEYIIDILQRHGFEAYAVGGCVRDSVLALTPEDWDITTSAKPEEVKACFRRTVDTGIRHGTVTVMLDDEGFEVTTYRIDGRYTDGRHPDQVTFTPNLRDDLMRRDFTINAMAYNDERGLVDLYGGMQDIQRRVVRCVGDPDARFDEDALRIMRAVRFAARFGFALEPRTRDAIGRHAEHLRLVSAERIREELVKTITALHPELFRDFYELGITAVILPEFDVCMRTPQHTPHHAYNVGDHIIRSMCEVPAEPVLRLTMLLHDLGKPAARTTDASGRDHFKGHAAISAKMADAILRRLRFDNDTRKQVVNLVRWHDMRPEPTPQAVRRAMVTVGPEHFEDYLAVQWADNMAKSRYHLDRKMKRLDAVYQIYRRVLADGDGLRIRELEVSGDDLKAAGFRGPEIGRILGLCLDAVLEDPRRNRRDVLLGLAGSAEKAGTAVRDPACLSGGDGQEAETAGPAAR